MSRITLKNIKHAAFASQETYCYSATVYFDGKKVGEVENDGHGGCDYEHITDKAQWSKMQDYIKTLPRIPYGFAEGDFAPTLEIICHDLVSQWLSAKDLKRLLSKRVVYKDKLGRTMQTNCAPNKDVLARWIREVQDEATTNVVLNTMPFEKALELYAA